MKPLVSPPMTMADFFEASRGTWLNRRVVHHLDSQDDESADSNLIIQPFDSTDPVVEKVCQVLNISASEANGGARFWWESNLMKEAKMMITQRWLLMRQTRMIQQRAFCCAIKDM